MRGTVVVFLKAPRAGGVKTRLGEEIGMGRATALFRVLTERTIAEAASGPWRCVLAVDPPPAVSSWGWPARHRRIAQGTGDLGERMARAFRTAPPGPVVIIGADAPGLRTRHLRQAFHALSGADAVFGPAADGGYWLIGLSRRRAAPDLFKDVRWSTKHTLDDTLKTLPGESRIAQLETLVDIDEAADLDALALRATVR